MPASNGASPLVNSSILHGLTGVQALRETNVTGRGITVAVIDTGIDYLHPALGGGIGNGFKVRFGLDLVGDNFQIGLPPQGKGDSYAECTAHGTHVSGIVAGDQPSLGFVGVAPEVNLEHYRVAGCRKAPIQSDIIIQAVLKAQSREVDVISISLTLNSGPYPDGTSCRFPCTDTYGFEQLSNVHVLQMPCQKYSLGYRVKEKFSSLWRRVIMDGRVHFLLGRPDQLSMF